MPIIGAQQTQLVQALYSRIKIKPGKETITPNQGVAQGSVISPSLFNIYAEHLLKQIELKESISAKDILAYADDTLVICESLEEAQRIIKTIRQWSAENSLKLNDKKSGIVEFLGRHMKPNLTETEFEGFPVCAEYKYLGLKLNNKLYMDSQLKYIQLKSEDIFRRLSPLLYKADLDTKKNLWQIFVQPLCEFVLPLVVQKT